MNPSSSQTDLLNSLIHKESLNHKLRTPRRPLLPEEPQVPENAKIALNINDLIQGKLAPQKLKEPENQTFTQLDALFDLIWKDVTHSRDRLLLLNAGRRNLIERRMEFIARKIGRIRGERFNRTLSLAEVLRETMQIDPKSDHKTLGRQAWDSFAVEAALFHMLELFLLKSLETSQLRAFEADDFSKMNFALHSFFNLRAVDFAHDKHCWNFVRSNLYSWHTLSRDTCEQLRAFFEKNDTSAMQWNDEALMQWLLRSSVPARALHLDFTQEQKVSEAVLRFLSETLNFSLSSVFHGQLVFKKVFIPSVELGSVAGPLLDAILNQPDATADVSKSLWACEIEGFEAFWAEAFTLLKMLRFSQKNRAIVKNPHRENDCRLPHVLHLTQMLGPELHNLDQLPLGGPELSRLQQGTAGQVQQQESFDLSVVTDHPDRAKSGRWLSALSSQLPYWRNLISSGSNLNWGELHLFLAISKLKENGLCVYLSHRVLPEGGDGDRFRKEILGTSTLECFFELNEKEFQPYRYLYVFKKMGDKHERDLHRPRTGKIRSLTEMPKFSKLEETNSNQAELTERGWNQMFVRGALPVIRHLHNKFPKLFQIASLQSWSDIYQKKLWDSKPGTVQPGSNLPIFSVSKSNLLSALEVSLTPKGVRFAPLPRTGLPENESRDALLVFPHNPADMHWLEALLNSAPVQFWIRQQILIPSTGKTLKIQDLKEIRSVPVSDLTRAPTELVHEALQWLGQHKPQLEELKAWALEQSSGLVERQAKFVAISKKYSMLQALILRYQPLFYASNWLENDEIPTLKPEAISQFYPSKLLSLLPQCPEVKIHYGGKDRTPIVPENWVITEVTAMQNNLIALKTRQGCAIQIHVPAAVCSHALQQFTSLKEHTWGEALSLVKLPLDTHLFMAQTTEVLRVVCQTAKEMRCYKAVLEEISFDLFEIAKENRRFLLEPAPC